MSKYVRTKDDLRIKRLEDCKWEYDIVDIEHLLATLIAYQMAGYWVRIVEEVIE